MNPQSILRLASQHVSEVRQDALSHRLAAAHREPRTSVRERAGWALIDVGLKLTGPAKLSQHTQARPANL
jgi:hypothetical protein